MIRTLIAAAAAAILWTAAAPAAFAKDPDEATIKEAQGYFDKGDTAYNLGRFDDAVTWFTKAYETWPVPDFLYNIAQAYRQAGNCKQALYFYKRYKSLKEKDSESPLSKKEKAEIERFIKELTDCAAKAETTATTQPDTLKTGEPDRVPDPTPAITPEVTPDSTPDPTPPDPIDVATAEEPEDDPEEDPSVATGMTAPTLVSARVTAGIAMIGAGSLEVPVQPSFVFGAGYPLPVGPVMLNLGVGLSYTPLPYESMSTSRTATLLGVRAAAGATYAINDKIGVRGDFGLGILSFTGLVDDNPFTEGSFAGTFTLLSVRLGIAAEYALTPNLVATLAPFSFAYSPGVDGLVIDSLTEIDVHVGFGYRM